MELSSIRTEPFSPMAFCRASKASLIPSADKVALEAIARAIAVEYAPYGIRANVIQAGVTDTPALRLIPGHKHLKAAAKMRNPFKRITTPEDVANFIYLMCLDEAAWANG